MLIVQRGKVFRLRVTSAVKLAYIYGKGLGVLANRRFRRGDVVLRFKANIVLRMHASHEAVTVDDKLALDTERLVPEAFINHSCSPNTMIDVVGFKYVAIRDIRKNDEVTYDYLTSEYDMTATNGEFRCHCGSRQCVNRVKGFRFLSHAQKLKRKSLLTPYLLKRLRLGRN